MTESIQTQKVQVMDGDGGSTIVVTGPFTGVKGLRVYGGPTDPISDMPVFVDSAHHHLHEGELHQYTYPPAALASAASVDHLIKVPNTLTATTRTPHFTIELDSTGECWVYLYEAPTTSADGTVQTPRNRNRNSATVPATGVYLTPTVSVVGTLIGAWIVGSGERSGGSGRDSIEFDLAKNTNYLVRITSKGTINVCLRLTWYEDLGV